MLSDINTEQNARITNHALRSVISLQRYIYITNICERLINKS
jgi:hypothetical protein